MSSIPIKLQLQTILPKITLFFQNDNFTSSIILLFVNATSNKKIITPKSVTNYSTPRT